MPLPPMQTIYVEGLPGTGKTFFDQCSMQNCKTVTGSNTSYSASAPTEELRRPTLVVLDEDFNEVHNNAIALEDDNDNDNDNDNNSNIEGDEMTTLDEEVYQRPWGGIQFVYSLGDTNQLNPVAKRTTYHQGTRSGADRQGGIQ
eukprot:scaffold39661_cov63-Cyclotella_meneghiniana.AAC.17